jgi:putative transposase
MNVAKIPVTNAANLSLFMVDVSQVLMSRYRQNDPDFSVLDLKAYFRGYRYVSETIEMLPRKPDGIFITQLFQKLPPWDASTLQKYPFIIYNGVGR